MILDVGDVAELEAFVKSTKSGSAVDPAEPKFRVRKPSGTVADVTAASTETGVFLGSFACEEAGIHRVLFSGTGANAVAGETQFRVRTPEIARS